MHNVNEEKKELVRDKFWIWGHEAGSHNAIYGFQDLSGGGISRMTPMEGACYLNVPNLIMVRYQGKPVPPYEQYAMAFKPLKQVVWSVVGAGGTYDNSDVEMVMDIASKFSNFTGFIMDDFFRAPDDKKGFASLSPEQLNILRSNLELSDRKLDLWTVLYTHQLELPVNNYLRYCDIVNLWTWKAQDLIYLEKNLERLESLAPKVKKILGCYMYDYGESKKMPLQSMEKQCEQGLQWLKEGRIDGMVFLASCICDLNLESVEWTREWIEKVGTEILDYRKG